MYDAYTSGFVVKSHLTITAICSVRNCPTGSWERVGKSEKGGPLTLPLPDLPAITPLFFGRGNGSGSGRGNSGNCPAGT
jgi:hypothetical protein